MDVYIGRQPIFDRQKNALGYELLFRSGELNCFNGIDGSLATSRVINNLLHSIGVEEVTGTKKVYINFTRELLLQGIPELLDPETAVIEILEDIEVDDEILSCCKGLVEKGYQLALDDFTFSENAISLLPLIQIVKVDVMQNDFSSLGKKLKGLSRWPVKFLAEKVEKEEEFEKAKELGFHLFQGYFFSKPQILNRKDITSDKWHKLQLLKAIQKPELDIDQLEELISRDVVISYKLLRYINSVATGVRVQVSSIRQASVLLGLLNLTRWLSLIILGEIGEGKPKELFTTASIRAKFCELLSLEAGEDDHAPGLFTTGMFSLLDAVMNRPLDELIKSLHLEDSIEEALLKKKGPLAPFLALVIAYEKGVWEEIVSNSENVGAELKKVSDCYLKAIQWAEDFMLVG